MFDFFKRKTEIIKNRDLEKALELNLISKQEFLELKILRDEAVFNKSEKELADFLEAKKGKKK